MGQLMKNIIFLSVLFCSIKGLYSSSVGEICADVDSEDTVYFPVEGNCAEYIECTYHSGTLYQCPSGLWWHQEIRQCDAPGSYCSDGTFPTSESTTEFTTVTETESTTESTTVTEPETTTVTAEPTTETETIPTDEPTTTSPITTITTTIIPETTTTIPETTTIIPETSTAWTSTPGNDPRCIDNAVHYFPHPEFCERYIECFEGDSYEMHCPSGLFFSSSLSACVSAEESECCTNKTCV